MIIIMMMTRTFFILNKGMTYDIFFVAKAKFMRSKGRFVFTPASPEYCRADGYSCSGIKWTATAVQSLCTL